MNGLKVSTPRHHILGDCTQKQGRSLQATLASKVPCTRVHTVIAARAAYPLDSTFWAPASFHLHADFSAGFLWSTRQAYMQMYSNIQLSIFSFRLEVARFERQ